MRAFIVLFFITCLACTVHGNVFISEIMYDPGNNFTEEWLEIYSDQPTNISGWKFYEDGTNHGLTLINGSWILDGYAVIADNCTGFLKDYPLFNSTLLGSSWSSLSNTGEFLAIKNKSLEFVDEVNYSAGWGGNDISLERIDFNISSNETSNWASSLIIGGTPGYQNSIFGSCDWSISIESDKTVYSLANGSIAVKWYVSLNESKNGGSAFFSYWVENSLGEIVKSKIEKSTNISSKFGKYQKTFYDAGGYIILANITSTACKDLNIANNLFSLPIIIKGESSNNSQGNSSLKIESFSPLNPTFGDIINVKINAYRGDTSKYAVYVYAEEADGTDISEKTTIHLDSKLTNYTMTVPVQLAANCDYKYANTTYNLVIEGLDLTDRKEIYIAGINDELCEEKIIEVEKNSEKTSTRGKITYEISEIPSTVYLNKAFYITLDIDNTYDEDVELDVWSYVYRGNKKYSEETENMKHITIEAEDSKEVKLENKIISGKEGTYNLKVKVRKEGRKTTYDKTKEIYLKAPLENEKSIEIKSKEFSNKNNNSEDNDEANSTKVIIRNSDVIYESEGYAIKKAIPVLVFFLFLLAIISSFIMFKEKR